jgi:hypothetical protein
MEWLAETKDDMPPTSIKILLANKIDIESKAITKEEGKEAAG